MIRFIPAWAGNTLRAAHRRAAETVHPRVGGEHPPIQGQAGMVAGSSPRGRGTHLCICERAFIKRFIPAWAGNTIEPTVYAMEPPVHPRVGGEHNGISGNNRVTIGSSPRGRGTRDARQVEARSRRFIPAWAGNTGFRMRIRTVSPVHPRVGGEHFATPSGAGPINGSSPRGRGTLGR